MTADTIFTADLFDLKPGLDYETRRQQGDAAAGCR
jgi:hypothetical protein